MKNNLHFFKHILHICTAGSVDDGKSTLIGQLLYQTKSIPEDKWAEIERASIAKGLDFIDLSLLTDGLIIEREKGITIDVAYIYFASATRKYILADTPGHIEYTRNMITGASQSQVCIIMIDAQKGILEQTHRHLYIACLLGMQEVVFCVNKMDLVGYEERIFNKYVADLQVLIASFDTKNTRFNILPISALKGENLVSASDKMPWYKGVCLLALLEEMEIMSSDKPVRFWVQGNIKTDTFQGITGKLVSGALSVGENVLFLQENHPAKVLGIYKGGRQVEKAMAGESLVLQVSPSLLPKRGECITIEQERVVSKTSLNCTLCWLDEQKSKIGQRYLLQQGVFSTVVRIEQIHSKIDIITLQYSATTILEMNDIAVVDIVLESPIYIDSFQDNAANGRFILIDMDTNHTVALGLA